jgi:hypothetical protein
MNKKHGYSAKCKVCKGVQTIQATTKDMDDWMRGKKIQNAMPYLTANERELLMSGICGTCYDNMFGEGAE